MVEPEDAAARLVVVDDDSSVAASVGALLRRAGYRVEAFTDPRKALARLEAEPVDLVLSDVRMPGLTGLELLERLRRVRAEVPALLLTGTPSLKDRMRAAELGVFRVVHKPFEREAFLRLVAEALQWGRLVAASASANAEKTSEERALERALEGLAVAFQPVYRAGSGELFGYEALLRSPEPTLRTPPEVLEAAKALGRLHTLGRRVRALVAAQAEAQPRGQLLFVNLHPADLVDPQLYAADAPLTKHARSVILELTGWSTLRDLDELDARLEGLRARGFRVAVDDLGAADAGLAQVAQVNPEVLKVGVSLTRGLHEDPAKRRALSSLCSLAHRLGVVVVAVGVETEQERACAAELGADLLQGFLLGAPGPLPQPA